MLQLRLHGLSAAVSSNREKNPRLRNPGYLAAANNNNRREMVRAAGQKTEHQC